MCRPTEEVGHTKGFQHHRYFVGFFNVSAQTPKPGKHFVSVAFNDAHGGYGGPFLVLGWGEEDVRKSLSKLIMSTR